MSTVAAGSQIGPCRSFRLLGSGAMAAACEARQVWLARRVALKTLRSELAGNRDAAARFFNDAKNLSRLEHPGLVQSSAFGHAPDGTAYLGMEYLRGESLGHRPLAQPGGLPSETVLHLAWQIAAVLDIARAAGVSHFGVAKLTGDGDRQVPPPLRSSAPKPPLAIADRIHRMLTKDAQQLPGMSVVARDFAILLTGLTGSALGVRSRSAVARSLAADAAPALLAASTFGQSIGQQSYRILSRGSSWGTGLNWAFGASAVVVWRFGSGKAPADWSASPVGPPPRPPQTSRAGQGVVSAHKTWSGYAN